MNWPFIDKLHDLSVYNSHCHQCHIVIVIDVIVIVIISTFAYDLSVNTSLSLYDMVCCLFLDTLHDGDASYLLLSYIIKRIIMAHFTMWTICFGGHQNDTKVWWKLNIISPFESSRQQTRRRATPIPITITPLAIFFYSKGTDQPSHPPLSLDFPQIFHQVILTSSETFHASAWLGRSFCTCIVGHNNVGHWILYFLSSPI